MIVNEIEEEAKAGQGSKRKVQQEEAEEKEEQEADEPPTLAKTEETNMDTS